MIDNADYDDKIPMTIYTTDSTAITTDNDVKGASISSISMSIFIGKK